ncbi:transcription factor IIIB 50 kDa subunit [Trichonephila clavipes]|nr:transcription factor IIIB 50 kDa subunit [Trichonephila clavipes]
MASVCQNCGESAFEVNAQEEQVCEACGTIVEDIHFGNEYNVYGSKTKPRLITSNKKQNSAGLTYGMNVLENLSKTYMLTSDKKNDASSLLKDIHSKKSFARKQDVGVLAGCCLIHVLQKQHRFISLTDLCSKLQCPKKKAFKFSKIVKSYCSSDTADSSNCDGVNVSEEPSSLEPTVILESLINQLLSSFEHKKDELISKTTALVKLAYSCWIASGRSYEGVISAAAYLCWRSMHPRQSLSLNKFCSDFSLPYTKAKPRVGDLKNMLLKLGKKVPYFYKNSVNEKNYLFHLSYILKNSDILRYDLLTKEFTEEEINKKEFSMYRKVLPTTDKNEAVQVVKEEDFNPDKCEDANISDAEISSYIRSKEEINCIKKLKEKFNVPDVK